MTELNIIQKVGLVVAVLFMAIVVLSITDVISIKPATAMKIAGVVIVAVIVLAVYDIYFKSK